MCFHSQIDIFPKKAFVVNTNTQEKDCTSIVGVPVKINGGYTVYETKNLAIDDFYREPNTE